MTRRVAQVAVAGLFLWIAQAACAVAQSSPAKWEIGAEEGSCAIWYGVADWKAERSSQIYGVIWTPGEGTAFLMLDRRASAPDTPIALEIKTAGGLTFSGPTDVKQAEDGPKSFLFKVEDRKDARSTLSGDITFNYRDIDGRPVTAVIPAGQQIPRIHKCMADARSQAKALASAPASASPPPAAAAAQQREPTLTSFGSGVFVDRLGHMLTNAHVVEGCRVVRSRRWGVARVVAVEESSDLALLRFPQGPRAFVRARSEPLRLGEPVTVAGFPLQDLLDNGLNVTTGNVSALAGPGGDRRFMQITAPIQAGNSGGPVLDASGRLVGLVVAHFKRTGDVRAENVNWAVSPFVIQAFLAEENITLGQGRSGDLRGAVIAEQAKAHTTALECLS